MPQHSLVDWITAASTALTAALAGVGSVLGFLGFRVAQARDEPEIEVSQSWSVIGGEQCLALRISVQNRSQRSHKIVECRITRPRHAVVGRRMGKPSLKAGEPADPRAARSIDLDRFISPEGQTTSFADMVSHNDLANIELYVRFAAGDARRLSIRLTTVDRSSKARRRRITINSKTAAKPSKSSDAIMR